MAHVRSDELAGSPDIFSSKKDTTSSSTTPAASAAEPEIVTAAAPATSDMTPPPPAPIATLEPPPPMAPPPPAPIATLEPPPPMAPPPPSTVFAPAPPARRSGSGVALGVVLVVVGIFYLFVQLVGIDLSSFAWPLFVIIPGLTLLILGLVSLGTGAAIPGGILTMVGLVLAVQSSTGYWASWAYAWPLIAPGGVGLGLFLRGLRERNRGLIRQGRSLIFISALIFMVGFVFFESILNLSGVNDQPVVKAALPALFIVIGILLLARSIQNSRRTT
jgi:hypothetical protein